MPPNLTRGAIEKIMQGSKLESPILQVLGQKKIAGGGGQSADRYRLLLSDGLYSHSSAMLATQLNDKVTSGELDTFSIIRLNKYLCNEIQKDRWVMILLDIDILASGTEIKTKIGAPQPYKHSSGGGGVASGPQQGISPPKPQMNGHGNHNGAAAASAPIRSGPSTPQQQSRPGFFGNKPGGAPGTPQTPGGTPARIHTITSLTPYQNRWTIRARVTLKSPIKTWSNSRGEGKLFSINLLDDTGEIRATAFRDQVDKFYDMLEVNKVFYFSKLQLKTANKQFSSVNNDYEMTFNSDTQVWLCEEDVDLPTVTFNFVPISNLTQHEANSTVDIIGIIKDAAELSSVTSKATQKEIKKRDLQIVDDNLVLVRMTLWGQEAESFNGGGNPVIAVKGCKVSDWGGRTLSASSGSQMIMNPDIPEAHHLRGWYDSEGNSASFKEFHSDGMSGGGGGHSTNWKTFAEVKSQNLGQDKPDYFTAKGTIVYLKKDNCMYQACPSENCNKKLVDLANGQFRCEKCSQETPNYKWRMILSVNLADFSDNQWVTCFQESAEAVMGKSADDMGSMRAADEGSFDQLFQEANFKTYIFKLRSKVETYNDESRLKTVCVQVTPMDYRDYNTRLLGQIDDLLAA